MNEIDLNGMFEPRTSAAPMTASPPIRPPARRNAVVAGVMTAASLLRDVVYFPLFAPILLVQMANDHEAAISLNIFLWLGGWVPALALVLTTGNLIAGIAIGAWLYSGLAYLIGGSIAETLSPIIRRRYQRYLEK